YVNVGFSFLALNRRDEARQVVQQALARGLGNPGLHFILYQLAFLENDTKGMEAQVASSSGKPGEGFALLAQSNSEAYFGRLGTARKFSQRASEIMRRGNFNEVAALARAVEALDDAEFGYSNLAKQVTSMALTLSAARNAKLYASLAFARAGDAARAQELADELDKRFPSNTLLQRYWLPTIRGSIELARKNPSGALGALQGVSYDLGTPDGPGVLYPVYVRGKHTLRHTREKKRPPSFKRFLTTARLC